MSCHAPNLNRFTDAFLLYWSVLATRLKNVFSTCAVRRMRYPRRNNCVCFAAASLLTKQLFLSLFFTSALRFELPLLSLSLKFLLRNRHCSCSKLCISLPFAIPVKLLLLCIRRLTLANSYSGFDFSGKPLALLFSVLDYF